MLTTREWVSIGIVALVLALLVARTRRTSGPKFSTFLKALGAWQILVLLGAWLAWIILCFIVALLLGWWNLGLLKDTIAIVLLLGLPALFRLNDQRSGGAIFVRIARDCLGITALLTFYINLASLPWFGEVLLQLGLLFLILLQAAAMQPKASAFQGIGGLLVVLLVVGAGAWTTVTLMQTAGQLDFGDVLRSFALSVWLPLALTPLLYVAAFLMQADAALVRVSIKIDEHWQRPRPPVSAAVVFGLHFSVRLAHRLNFEHREVGRGATFRDTLRRMRDFRSDVRDRDRREHERNDALRRYARVRGVDANGAQLDRRDFAVTKERLQHIMYSETARRAGSPGTFWSDDEFRDQVVMAKIHGLPEAHGFVVETSHAGESWRAWRETPSGWFLGTGGLSPNSEWLYSGAEPPPGFPTPDDPRWVDLMTDPSQLPDWDKDDEPIN